MKKFSKTGRAPNLARMAVREDVGEEPVETAARLDVYLAGHYPELSRASWQKYIASGAIMVNNAPAKNSKQLIDESDVVVVNFPERHDFSQSKLPVIYEDENVVVVNKPAGILSHSKGELNDEFTVAEFFRSKTTFGNDTNRPGIIHRLDRATSGVMLGAKNPETAKMLQRQFADRKTKKTYMALISKTPKNLFARIDLPIGRDPKHPSRFRVDANGKNAVTDYDVRQVFADGSCLIELRPMTGRTHQLRVHLAYIGTPIVGDRVYGRAGDRLFLHAAKLEITIPESQRKVFEAPLPVDFTEAIDERATA